MVLVDGTVQLIIQLRSLIMSNFFNLYLKLSYCFVLGDLNFRIELERDEVIEKIQNYEFDSMLEKDQLIKARREEGILPDIKEALITLAPT